MSELEIAVDKARCIGSGLCMIASADHFAQDEDGFVVLLPPAASDDAASDPAVRDAVNDCPSAALSWRKRATTP